MSVLFFAFVTIINNALIAISAGRALFFPLTPFFIFRLFQGELNTSQARRAP